jgi:Holliday junction resolvase
MGAVQEEKGLPKHKLRGDCVTRWGSTLTMMERLVEQQQALRIVLANDRKVSHVFPSWQDLDVLDLVLAVLRPFKQLTDLLSGNKYVPVSIVKPLLNYIYTNNLAAKPNDTSLTVEIKDRMKEKVKLCFQEDEIDELLNLCSIVDAHFMLSVLQSDDQAKREQLLKVVTETMIELGKDQGLETSEDNLDNANKKFKPLLQLLLAKY